MFALTHRCRKLVLALVPLLLLIGVLSLDPIPQDRAYHSFADQRTLFGIRHFANVVSNLPFLIFGLIGLGWVRHARRGASLGWATFFTGVTLTCLGSGYYHGSPDNATLLWDRLPMTIAFMGLLVALLAEHIDPALERYLLAPALVVGGLSIAWWHYTGDLRLYGWVQFTPLVLVPLVLALYPNQYSHRRYLLYSLGFYLAAKVAEACDREVWALTGQLLSGHTVKHLLASISVLTIYRMLVRRDSMRV